MEWQEAMVALGRVAVAAEAGASAVVLAVQVESAVAQAAPALAPALTARAAAAVVLLRPMLHAPLAFDQAAAVPRHIGGPMGQNMATAALVLSGLEQRAPVEMVSSWSSCSNSRRAASRER